MLLRPKTCSGDIPASGAINLAKSLGETDAVTLLEENLAQEKKALSTLETIAKRLGATQRTAA